MNLPLEFIGYGVVVPALISTAVVFNLPRLLPEKVGYRYAGAIAVASAFFVGYALLPEWAELTPQRHWHWLPYLGLAAAVLAPVGLANGVHTVERWLLFALLAVCAAWLLVPTWASLKPPRGTYIPILAVYLFLLMALIELLPNRVSPRFLALALLAAALVTTVAVTAFVSVRYGTLGGIAVAALVGCGGLFRPQQEEPSLRAAAVVYALLIGGVAFVGFVEPEPPLRGILVLPAAPVALWLVCWGPLVKLGGRKRLVLQSVVILVPLVVGAVLVWLAQRS